MRLSKETSRSTNYYTINIYPTLFDDFMLAHHCGKRKCIRKSARSYFPTKKDALLHSLSLIEEKKSEGFRLVK